MTSRERVKRVLNRQPVDRIPNGLGGCETTGLHILAYNKLKKVLGVNDSCTRMYTFMTNAVVEPPVLQAMNGDIIMLGSKLCPSGLWGNNISSQWKPKTFWSKLFLVPSSWNFRTLEDGTILWDNCNWRCPPGSIYFDPVPQHQSNNIYSVGSLPDPDTYNPPYDIPDEKLRSLEDSARWLYQNTDYSICCGETITDLQLNPDGIENWWALLVEEPDIAHEFLHKACEAGISQLKLIHQAVGKYADMIAIADDMGDVRDVTIGPDLWRKIYKPHYKRLFTACHQITGMKISLHSCGSILNILDDLIECGIDVLNPVQISANGMEPEKLKREFGDRLIFYGGCFDAVLTPPDTPERIVYERVKENIITFNEGGGYIFAGVHNIPGNTPESHIKAILEAYNDCCKSRT